MNTIIKIGLGIALALPLSTPITTVKDAYGIVEAPSSFSSLSNISPKKLVAHSPMSGEQLAAIKGMAGICISCLGETTIDPEATVNQSNQFVGPGPVTQNNQAMVNQTIINQAFSPSREQLSVVMVQQSQTLPIQFPNEQQATNLAREIINQAIMNGAVNTTTINQQFTNIPRGGFLR